MDDYLNLGATKIWLPYTQMHNHLPQVAVEKTRGTKIYLKNQQFLIDGISSWWSACHGYNHPHIEKNIRQQLKKIPHLMLAGLSNESTYELAYRLAEFCQMDKVFFSDSGSTAIEVAMKMAWQYHINHKNYQKTKFICFKNSYHGDTSGAMALADLNHGMHKKFANILLKNYCFDLPSDQSSFNSLNNFLANNNADIAAIVIEPLVQCASGMKFHSIDTLNKIFKLAHDHKILVIVDECATGFYRTGKKFAYQYSNYRPDILTVGKALTGGFMGLAATLCSNKIYDSFLDDSLDKALMHGPTFMGNALACKAACASLDLFESHDYEKNVEKITKILKQKLKKCYDFKKVIEVRVIGAIGVVEIKTNWEEIKILRQKFIEKGVFLRPFANCIYLMPALNISKKDLVFLCDKIYEVLQNIEQ